MDGARELAWAVTPVGRSHHESQAEFERLAGEVEHDWNSVFLRRFGYETQAVRTTAPTDRADRLQTVRLTVERGDFVGQLELCCEPQRETALVIRAVASARSRELSAAREWGRRTIVWSSGLASLVGAAASVGFCWLTIGAESAPLVVGLMLTTIIGILLVGGHALGVRIGEDLARAYELHARRHLDQDGSLQADLKRWNSLGRQLRVHRRALSRGLAGTPFRRAS